MNFDRWYTTTIMLGDGREFVLGGQANPDTYVHIPDTEVFNPSNNTWSRLDPDWELSLHFPDAQQQGIQYC